MTVTANALYHLGVKPRHLYKNHSTLLTVLGGSAIILPIALIRSLTHKRGNSPNALQPKQSRIQICDRRVGTLSPSPLFEPRSSPWGGSTAPHQEKSLVPLPQLTAPPHVPAPPLRRTTFRSRMLWPSLRAQQVTARPASPWAARPAASPRLSI